MTINDGHATTVTPVTRAYSQGGIEQSVIGDSVMIRVGTHAGGEYKPHTTITLTVRPTKWLTADRVAGMLASTVRQAIYRDKPIDADSVGKMADQIAASNLAGPYMIVGLKVERHDALQGTVCS